MKNKKYLNILLLLTVSFDATAMTALLTPLPKTSDSRSLTDRVESKYDQFSSNSHFTFVDASQSFRIRESGDKYLIAVNYFSKEYANQVCEMALVNNSGEILSRIVVGGERSNGDEVAASCVAINAVSGRNLSSKDDVIYVVNRLRAGQSYWSSGSIVRIDRQLRELYIDKATQSIDTSGNGRQLGLKDFKAKTLLGR
jgi:hypothetical protein